MSRSRSRLLGALKVLGEATADQLADDLGLSAAAVRQQLAPLGAHGLIAHRDDRSGPGRPRRWYCLAPAAESLFPKRYGQLANQLLGIIGDQDPSLLEEAFVRRGTERQRRAAERLGGLGPEEAVAEMAAILDEDGYLATWEQEGEGRWRISELNCAILDVAREHHSACRSEIAFLRAALPWAHIERVTHILSGAHACSYEVQVRAAAPADPDGDP